jgi:flagellar hook-length control protein FliK
MQPPHATKAGAQAEAMPSSVAPANIPPPTAASLNTLGEGGEEPSGDRSTFQPPGLATGDAPAHGGANQSARPQTSADRAAPPHPSPEANASPKPQADIAAAAKPIPDTNAEPKSGAEASIRPQSHPDAGAAVKSADMAMQNLGLTAAASQTPAANLATNATPPQATASAQAPAAPVPLAGLAVEIATAAHAGKRRFEIRLDPPELGRIDVRLDVDRDGNVTSRMTVERAETLDLLKRDAAQLERALHQAGLKTSDQALEFSLRQQAFAREDNVTQNAARLIVSEDQSAPLDAARQGYGHPLGLGGGLDIRV